VAKIVVECGNPNDLKEVEALVEQAVGKCNITYYQQHKGMVEAGASKSKSESARIIAQGTKESPEAVRCRIRRGEKESGQLDQEKSKTPDNQGSTEFAVPKQYDSGRGGAREGAGRKRAPRRQLTELEKKERIVDKDFQEGFELMSRALENAIYNDWKKTSKEAAIKHIKILYGIVNFHCDVKTTIDGGKFYV